MLYEKKIIIPYGTAMTNKCLHSLVLLGRRGAGG